MQSKFGSKQNGRESNSVRCLPIRTGIDEYMNGYRCALCANFNPKCKNHYHYYFASKRARNSLGDPPYTGKLPSTHEARAMDGDLSVAFPLGGRTMSGKISDTVSAPAITWIEVSNRPVA